MTDNWYTTLVLVKELRGNGFNFVGTVRENRKDIPKPSTKGMKRGETRFFQHKEDIHFLIWMDAKPVRILSTLSSPVRVSQTCLRWVGKKGQKTQVGIPIPHQVTAYNKAMGGTDLGDIITKRRKRILKTSRWPLKVFAFLLDKTLANSWLIWR